MQSTNYNEFLDNIESSYIKMGQLPSSQECVLIWRSIKESITNLQESITSNQADDCKTNIERIYNLLLVIEKGALSPLQSSKKDK